MLVRAQSQRLTAAQYLELEQIGDVCHEDLVGERYELASADLNPQIIAGNIYVYLQLTLWESAYQVYTDTKVRIDAPLRFYYPDVSVVSKIKDRSNSSTTHPCLIIEVIDSFAGRINRWEKWLAYQNLATLTEYVIVSQDRVLVEVYCRNNRGEWQLKVFGAGESVELVSVGLKLNIDRIYEDVCF